MDVAENPHNARPPETYGSRRAGSIEPKIENLAVISGECAVKDGVAVGKVDCGARYHRHNMRCEHLVLLEHHRVLSGGGWRGFVNGTQRDHNAGIVLAARD